MWTGVITNAGAALLAQYAAGGTLNITGAAAGSGTVPEAALMSLTALTSQQQALSIIGNTAVTAGRKLDLQFAAHTSAYTAQQVGIFARIGTGAATLLAIFQDAGGIAVPSASDMPDYVYVFHATLNIDNSGTLNVTIDTSANVSQAQLAAGLAGRVAVGAVGDEAVASLPDTSGEYPDIRAGDSVGTLFAKVKAWLSSLKDKLNSHSHSLQTAEITGVLPADKGGTGHTSLQAARNSMGLGDTTGALPVANGGTGATTAPAAKAALGLGTAEQNFRVTATSTENQAYAMRAIVTNSNYPGRNGHEIALILRENGLLLYDSTAQETIWPLALPVPINYGGTGATNTADARTKLGITPANIGAAATSHTHDDRYYTESEMDTKLAGKSATGHTHALGGDTVTGTLPVTKGGTGATAAAAARSNLGITPANIGAFGADSVSGVTNANNTSLYGSAFLNAANCSNLPSTDGYYQVEFMGAAQTAFRFSADGVTAVYARYYTNSKWYPWVKIDLLGGGNVTGAIIKTTNLDYSESRQSAVSSPMIQLKDVNGLIRHQVFTQINASNSFFTYLQTRDGVHNAVHIAPGMDANGNAVYLLSHPAAFRDALGIGNSFMQTETCSAGSSIEIAGQHVLAVYHVTDSVCGVVGMWNTGSQRVLQKILTVGSTVTASVVSTKTSEYALKLALTASSGTLRVFYFTDGSGV